MQTQKLSALQLELLNVYSFQPKEEDLLAIKTLLAKYFSGNTSEKYSEGNKGKKHYRRS